MLYAHAYEKHVYTLYHAQPCTIAWLQNVIMTTIAGPHASHDPHFATIIKVFSH